MSTSGATTCYDPITFYILFVNTCILNSLFCEFSGFFSAFFWIFSGFFGGFSVIFWGGFSGLFSRFPGDSGLLQVRSLCPGGGDVILPLSDKHIDAGRVRLGDSSIFRIASEFFEGFFTDLSEIFLDFSNVPFPDFSGILGVFSGILKVLSGILGVFSFWEYFRVF